MLAGGKGFEPLTLSLEVKKVQNFDLQQYRDYVYNKYAKQYACMQYQYAVKFYDCIENPSKMLSLSASKRRNVLKAMVCLSKYLGCYEQYRIKLKSYGIKWNNEDTAFNGFLAIFSKKHQTLSPWLKDIQPYLSENEKVFVRFLAITGLRKNEALTAYNMILDLIKKDALTDYYNPQLHVLEHFKFGRLFLRGTKNAYISFVPQSMIEQISKNEPVSYDAMMCRFKRKHINVRFKELRSYHNSYLRKNGVISELVDVLAGRVPKTVFCRHYLAETMVDLSTQVLGIEKTLEESLFTP
jgi:hypothetical protein